MSYTNGAWVEFQSRVKSSSEKLWRCFKNFPCWLFSFFSILYPNAHLYPSIIKLWDIIIETYITIQDDIYLFFDDQRNVDQSRNRKQHNDASLATARIALSVGHVLLSTLIHVVSTVQDSGRHWLNLRPIAQSSAEHCRGTKCAGAEPGSIQMSRAVPQRPPRKQNWWEVPN